MYFYDWMIDIIWTLIIGDLYSQSTVIVKF
jgi:hypothetical protein